MHVQTRIYRNDGRAMAGGTDDPELDYIDPGIVLLYADAEQSVLCSYFEASLNQPIQATAEYSYSDPSTALSDLADAVSSHEVLADGRVEPVPRDDPSSPRWVFEGLQEERLPLHERDVAALRVALADESSSGADSSTARPTNRTGGSLTRHLASLGEWLSWNGSTASGEPAIDFGVGNYRAAARLFKFLFEEYHDLGVSIAVSKSGRIDDLADTDVVVHVDESYTFADETVVAIGETEQLLRRIKERHIRDELREGFSGPLLTLHDRYASTDNRTEAADELQDLFGTLFADSGFRLVDKWRVRRRIVLSGLVGLVVGLYLGLASYHQLVALDPTVRLYAGRLYRTGSDLLAGVPRTYVGSALGSVVALAGTWRLRRRLAERDRAGHPTKQARYDAIRIGLGVALLVSATVLFVSLASIVVYK